MCMKTSAEINNYPSWLVPIELAVKLKEIGFDIPCVYFYNLNSKFLRINTHDTQISGSSDYRNVPFIYANDTCERNSNEYEDCISLPTYEQAFDWFRSFSFVFDFLVLKELTGYLYCVTIKLSGQELRKTEKFDTFVEARNEMLETLIGVVGFYKIFGLE